MKENPDGTRTVHEVKKSRAVATAHRLQMLHYLSILKEKGIAARGQIDYPLLKRNEQIELTPQSEAELQSVLNEIEQIVSSEAVPPRLPNKRFCEQCAYFELCWS